MVYLISYELNSDKDYTNLYDAIKSYGAWWHFIDSTWLIDTSQSAQEVSEKLLRHIDKNEDVLLVMKVLLEDRQGWLPKKAWEWIRNKS